MKRTWPKVRLGEVLRYRKDFINIDDLLSYKRPKVQLHAKGIVLRDEVHGALIKTKTQQVCRAGEFLVAEIDAKVGGYGIVPEDLDGAIVSSHYFLFDIDDSKLDRRFLDYFIRTSDFHDQVEAQGSTNYAAIRPSQVLNYEILLPPLAEQLRIVARIEELAVQINEANTLRHKAVIEAEALVASKRFEMFDKITPKDIYEFDSAIIQLRGKSGLPLKAYKPHGKYPVIDQGQKYIAGYCDDDDRVLSPPSPVVVWGDHTTNVKLVDFPFVPGADGTKVFLPRKDILVPFLKQFLKSVKYPDLGYSRHYRYLKKVIIPVPTLNEQRFVVAEMDALQVEVDQLKALQAETIAELEALLSAILDKAFKGEL